MDGIQDGRSGPFGAHWGFLTLSECSKPQWQRVLFGATWELTAEWTGGSDRIAGDKARLRLVADRALDEFRAGRIPDLEELWAISAYY